MSVEVERSEEAPAVDAVSIRVRLITTPQGFDHFDARAYVDGKQISHTYCGEPEGAVSAASASAVATLAKRSRSAVKPGS